jgi:hypothetical protein
MHLQAGLINRHGRNLLLMTSRTVVENQSPFINDSGAAMVHKALHPGAEPVR